MQAGVTCTSFANYTAWKWQLVGKKKQNLAPKLVAYALTQTFSRKSHQCGHDSLSLIAVYIVMGGLHNCDHLGPTP